MPTPIRTLVTYEHHRRRVVYCRDGAAMRDQNSLIEAHIPGLRRFACALPHGDRQSADDLAQDCLERAPARWHLRGAEGVVRGWLYTILYNAFRARRMARRGVADALFEVAKIPGVAGQDRALEHRYLFGAFAALPEEQRSVVVLIGVEGLSCLRAASMLGVPIGTVMTRLSWAASGSDTI